MQSDSVAEVDKAESLIASFGGKAVEYWSGTAKIKHSSETDTG